MDLIQLYDEERYIPGEEERREQTEEEGGGVITWCSATFKRVRLFKAEAVIKKNRSSRGGYQNLPLYVVIEDTVVWAGEDPKYPNNSQRRRTYVTGPDSTRIRQVVKIAEAYGGTLNA